MNPYKIGDLVMRIKGEYAGVVQGTVGKVVGIDGRHAVQVNIEGITEARPHTWNLEYITKATKLHKALL